MKEAQVFADSVCALRTWQFRLRHTKDLSDAEQTARVEGTEE